MCFEDRAGLFGAIASDLDDTRGLFKFDDYFTLESQPVRRLRSVAPGGFDSNATFGLSGPRAQDTRLMRHCTGRTLAFGA
jgi:hypothetical protein